MDANILQSHKKIGSFDGYRTNAFFGFNVPQSSTRIIHFNVPVTPSKHASILSRSPSLLEFLQFENEVNELIETIEELDKKPATASIPTILENEEVKTAFIADPDAVNSDCYDSDEENSDCFPLLKENIRRHTIALSESSVDDESPFRDITYKLILERSLSTIDEEESDIDSDELDESGMEDDEKLEISPSSKESSIGTVGAASSGYASIFTKSPSFQGYDEEVPKQEQSPESSDKESGIASDLLEQRVVVLNKVVTTFEIKPTEPSEPDLVTTGNYQSVEKYFADDLCKRLSHVNENELQNKFFEMRRWKPLESLELIDDNFVCSTPHSELTSSGDYTDCEEVIGESNKEVQEVDSNEEIKTDDDSNNEIKADDQLVLEPQDKQLETNRENLKESSDQDDGDNETSSSHYKLHFRVVKRRRLSWTTILRRLAEHEKKIAKQYELQEMMNVRIEENLSKIDSAIDVMSELIGDLSGYLRCAYSQMSDSFHQDSSSSSKISSCLVHSEE